MPANYIRAESISWISGCASTIPANAVYYLGTARESGALATVEWRVPYSGTIERLLFDASGAPGAGETYTYTMMIRGGAGTVTCVTAGAVDTQSEDLVNGDAVVVGDLIAFRVETSLNAAAFYHKGTICLRY